MRKRFSEYKIREGVIPSLYCEFRTKKLLEVIYNKNKRTKEEFKGARLQLPAGLNNLRFNYILHKSENVVKGNVRENNGRIRLEDRINGEELLNAMNSGKVLYINENNKVPGYPTAIFDCVIGPGSYFVSYQLLPKFISTTSGTERAYALSISSLRIFPANSRSASGASTISSS